MNRHELAKKLKPVLRRRQDALRASLEGELRYFSTSEDRVVGDYADAAVDDDYAFISSNLAESESRELQRIEEALQRISDGTYGLCEECDEPIPVARLKALPYATACIACQRAIENGDDDGPAPVRNRPAPLAVQARPSGGAVGSQPIPID